MSTLVPRLLAIAGERGDAAAIAFGGSPVLSYTELYGRAAALARRLASAGCGPESIVALGVPASPEYVIGVLGAWLAGAAFAPLDWRHPEARKRQALTLLRPSVVLTAAELAETATADISPRSISAADLAYVICSSGTTGTPKAIAVTHRGLPAVIEAQVALFGIEPTSRVLWTLSPAFDASVSDIMCALCAGATLHIEPEAALLPGVTLEPTLAERGITHWDVPPAILRRMNAASLPACVETLVIGGEVTPPEVVRAFARRCRVVNVYGPTEASICTSMVRCDPETWTKPLIGEPIPGVLYRVEDDELLIGGPGVARGYVDDLATTALRFVERDGARWYRTRDRVKADGGALEFLGRIDRQLKVQGVLVEPEEIEACLSRFPGLTGAAVVASAHGVLSAFVAPAVDPDSLRAHLRDLLPASHVPAHIVMLGALPRVASGKVDHVALRELATMPVTKGGEGGALGGLWAQALGIPAVGLDDDVRLLGATSLDALVVIARAHAAGLTLSPEAIASRRTVRTMLEPAPPRSAAWLRHDVRPLVPQARGHGTAGGGRVLLTGGTGFIGARLLGALLAAGREVVCLVRDPARLPEHPRLTWVRGDLERERLGLSRDRWLELGREVADVVHCAARVNMLASYADLRDANVVGTSRVLELCDGKRLTYVSTLSVLASADHDGAPTRFDESFPLERTRAVHGGYAQSKWAAEQLVREANLPGSACVRLGLTVGEGMARHDLLALVLRGIAHDGTVPAGLPSGLATGAMPVAWVADALAALVAAPRPADGCATFHLVSEAGMTFAMLRKALAEHGDPVTEVEAAAWLSRAAPTITTAALSHALEPERFGVYRALDPFAASELVFGVEATRSVLVAAGVSACPPPTFASAGELVRHVLRDDA